MAYTSRLRILLPIGTSSLFSLRPSLSSRIPFLQYSGEVRGKFQPLIRWMHGFQSVFSTRASRSHWKSYIQKLYTHDISKPVCRLSLSCIFGIPVMSGSLGPQSYITHSMDGFDVLLDNHHTDLSHTSSSEDYQTFLTFAKKLVALAFLLFTVLLNWNRPVILAAKVILIFLSTKPNTYSLYQFVDQLRSDSIRQKSFLNMFKSSSVKKVEVEDYTFLCIAKVEFEDKELMLIGILGGWWALPVALSENFVHISNWMP